MTVDELERDSVVPLRRRHWKRRLLGWRRWLIGLAVLGAVMFAAWVFFFSSWLGMRSLQVDGARHVSRQQVVSAASVATGTPLARIDLGSIEAKVRAIPAVASATARRSWPNTIIITVTERQPIAVVRHDDAWWEMDKTGVLFKQVAAPAPTEPIVELLGNPSSQTLPQVGSVLAALPPTLLTSTQRVTASSMDSITLVLDSGSQVRWGTASDSGQKAAVLQALLHRKARIYDVTIPSQPATIG